METQPGRVIASQFRLERELGRGGMGAVYLAEQLGVARPVVVKLMHPVVGSDTAGASERFQLEARLGAQLNHPHVVQIYVFGQTEAGEFYLAMEYVNGQSLAEVLAREGPLPEARVLRIAYQACDALSHAHHAGLVHRDLKPANLMICERHGNRDYLKVLDFGIAKSARVGATKLTGTGMIVGTPEYMAPEQARGLPVDARTDVYALGCVLYELLGGETPFVSNSTTDMLIAHVIRPPTPLCQRFPGLLVQPRVEALVHRCLQKDPALRFQSASELQEEIRRALNERPSAFGNVPFSPLPPTQSLSNEVPAHLGSRPNEHPSASPTAHLQKAPSPRTWQAVAIPLGVAALVSGVALTYAMQRPKRATPPWTIGPNVTIGPGVVTGAPSLRTNTLWEAFGELREVQDHCLEDYFERVPLEGPKPDERYYVGMGCPSSMLQSASAKSAEADAPPFAEALSALTKACKICSDARQYYDSGEYTGDHGARGQTLHAAMVSAASRYVHTADEAERWLYRSLTDIHREALQDVPPASTARAFRALVVAGYAVIAARERQELSTARQQLEHAVHEAEERMAATDPRSAGALNSHIGLARQLLTATLLVERTAPPGTRLPPAGKAYESSNDWRRVTESAPSSLLEARRQQGRWFEGVLELAGTLEELEHYAVLR